MSYDPHNGISSRAPAGGGGPGHFATAAQIGSVGAPAPNRCTVVVSCSTADKALLAAHMALPKMPGHLAEEVAGLLTPEGIAVIGAAAAVWAGSHYVGVGFVVDAVIAGVGVVSLGWEAIRAGKEFVAFWSAAERSRSNADLDIAADHFASGVSIVGINGLMIFGAKKIGNKSGAARTEAIVSRWARYIETLQLKPRSGRGALWSKLFDDPKPSLWARLVEGKSAVTPSKVQDWEVAAALAKRDGRVTLEMMLSDSEFWKIYKAEFGTNQNAVTKRIWEMLSEKFTKGLQGEIVAYVDSAEVIKAIAVDKSPILVKTELAAVRKVIAKNNSITSVVFEDIWTRQRSKSLSRADLARMTQH